MKLLNNLEGIPVAIAVKIIYDICVTLYTLSLHPMNADLYFKTDQFQELMYYGG